MQLAGSVLTLFALGRQMTGVSGGAAAALFGALSGGFGWLKARGAALVFDPRGGGGQAATQYLGDLLYRRSYNSSFHNLVPVFPRDVAYVLLGGFLLLCFAGLADDRARARLLVGGGLLLGLIGLTGGESFVVGLAAAIGIGLGQVRGRRLKTLACVVLPALVLSSLWLIPLAFNYVRFGGFVNTASPLVALDPLSVLGAWGIVAPFALLGVASARQAWGNPAVRAATTFLLISLGFRRAVLGLSANRGPRVHDIGAASPLLATGTPRSRAVRRSGGVSSADARVPQEPQPGDCPRRSHDCACDPVPYPRKRCLRPPHPARTTALLIVDGTEEHRLQPTCSLHRTQLHCGGSLLVESEELRLLGLPLCPVSSGPQKLNSAAHSLPPLLRCNYSPASHSRQSNLDGWVRPG